MLRPDGIPGTTNGMQTFRAPWGTALRLVSAFTTLLLLGIAAGLASTDDPVKSLVALGSIAILAIAGLFTVRGYTVAPDALLIRRLAWTTRVPLAGLQSVRFEPDVMTRSIRLFGNGGLYSFTGVFRNRQLGRYRAFVTDLHRTVVLCFPGRTMVVSPADPPAFVEELRPLAGR